MGHREFNVNFIYDKKYAITHVKYNALYCIYLFRYCLRARLLIYTYLNLMSLYYYQPIDNIQEPAVYKLYYHRNHFHHHRCIIWVKVVTCGVHSFLYRIIITIISVSFFIFFPSLMPVWLSRHQINFLLFNKRNLFPKHYCVVSLIWLLIIIIAIYIK